MDKFTSVDYRIGTFADFIIFGPSQNIVNMKQRQPFRRTIAVGARGWPSPQHPFPRVNLSSKDLFPLNLI